MFFCLIHQKRSTLNHAHNPILGNGIIYHIDSLCCIIIDKAIRSDHLIFFEMVWSFVRFAMKQKLLKDCYYGFKMLFS
jgi:hypothetical protein